MCAVCVDGKASENSAQWRCGEPGCLVGSYKRARMCVCSSELKLWRLTTERIDGGAGAKPYLTSTTLWRPRCWALQVDLLRTVGGHISYL